MTKAEIISELEELKAQFEQRVIDRVDLILKAQKVAGILDYRAGDTDTDIRAKAVAHARGAESTQGRSVDYIEAMFDHLAEQIAPDPVRTALADARIHH